MRQLACNWFKHLICLWLLTSCVTVIRAQNEVLSSTKFENPNGQQDLFGCSMTGIGNLDSSADEDLAIGASNYATTGAVFIMFMESGEVNSHQIIHSATTGGFTATLAESDAFGSSIASMGDYNGDGHAADILVGASGSSNHGIVYLLFLRGMIKNKTTTLLFFFISIYVYYNFFNVCMCLY